MKRVIEEHQDFKDITPISACQGIVSSISFTHIGFYPIYVHFKHLFPILRKMLSLYRKSHFRNENNHFIVMVC